MSSSILYYPVASKVFSPGPVKPLLELLAAVDEATLHIRIEEPTQLRLDQECRLHGNWTFTDVGLHSMCQTLCPPLYPYLRYMTQTKIGSPARVSGPIKAVCLGTFNATAKLNFDAMIGSKLIVNKRSNRIDGCVGRRYQFVSNLKLCDYVLDAVGNGGEASGLQFARLSGRTLEAYFLIDKLFSDGSIYYGVYVVNSETRARSIHLANFVVFPKQNLILLEEYSKEGVIRHVKGKKFRSKVLQAIDAVKQNRVKPDELKAMLGGASSVTYTRDELELLIKRLSRTELGSTVLGMSWKLVMLQLESNLRARGVVRKIDLVRAISNRAWAATGSQTATMQQLAFKVLRGK